MLEQSFDATEKNKNLDAAVALLRRLIAVPSFSRDESCVSDVWHRWFCDNSLTCERLKNNIIACGISDPRRPTLLLNSHMDTVRPAASYTRDPFCADIEGDRIYGLGSNDAGAAGVALAYTYLELQKHGNLPVNLVLAITAEEEISGENGMRLFLDHMKNDRGVDIDMAIVGEPTGLRAAVAERGLLVFDCETRGKSGHAARGEGINAIYRAIDDIEALRRFAPSRVSDVLGPISVNVTIINAGTQHNVVPDLCTFVADVRTTDAYSNQETVDLLRETVKWSILTPRSTRVHASVIADTHPLVQSARSLGIDTFVSPTTSDMALMYDIPSLKIGPGESSRSHAADEFVLISELNRALNIYPKLICNL